MVSSMICVVSLSRCLLGVQMCLSLGDDTTICLFELDVDVSVLIFSPDVPPV